MGRVMNEQAEAGAVERLTEWLDLRDKPQSALMSDDYIHALVWDKAPGDTIMDDDLRTLLSDLARMKAALEGAVRLYETAKRSADNQRAFIDVRDLEAFTSDARLALRQHEDGR